MCTFCGQMKSSQNSLRHHIPWCSKKFNRVLQFDVWTDNVATTMCMLSEKEDVDIASDEIAYNEEEQGNDNEEEGEEEEDDEDDVNNGMDKDTEEDKEEENEEDKDKDEEWGRGGQWI